MSIIAKSLRQIWFKVEQAVTYITNKNLHGPHKWPLHIGFGQTCSIPRLLRVKRLIWDPKLALSGVLRLFGIGLSGIAYFCAFEQSEDGDSRAFLLD